MFGTARGHIYYLKLFSSAGLSLSLSNNVPMYMHVLSLINLAQLHPRKRAVETL
jgi:hypothetical protein